jgi:hypothetical protein
MKRIVMLLTVMALMLVMVAMSVAPAFGSRINQFGCIQKSGFALVIVSANPALFSPYDRNNDGIVCSYHNPQGKVHFTDNHLH